MTIHTLAAALAHCNFHLCVSAAFGSILIVRAVLAHRHRKHEEAHEQGVHGVLHILLALL